MVIEQRIDYYSPLFDRCMDTTLKFETLEEYFNTTSVQVKRADEEKIEEDEELGEFLTCS